MLIIRYANNTARNDCKRKHYACNYCKLHNNTNYY
uniref:Uncharacterized protein n=1 Tax=Klebsiella phage FKP3 TaxID=3231233 RepID=A0AAU8HZQ2_9CAUD